MYVQECRPCHPECRGCEGSSDALCIDCANYKQKDDQRCVASCSREYYADEATKQCIECSRQCAVCRGPTAADCISCRYMKLYHNLDERNPDSPVCWLLRDILYNVCNQPSCCIFLLAIDDDDDDYAC